MTTMANQGYPYGKLRLLRFLVAADLRNFFSHVGEDDDPPEASAVAADTAGHLVTGHRARGLSARGNGANPAPAPAGPLKRKRGQTVLYDTVPLAVVPPGGATSGCLRLRRRCMHVAGGRAKSRSAPPRAPPAPDVVLLRKRDLPP
ncbi:hypothetical protein GUJ93_ZPchr0012g21400 [Zizania palustris]|uniref:Uncharacterized protein n=1 Tax=Zizania palustris TaxID=103762 RepID=A0A8J5WSW7_ZIZPA|nr:hypothetical protein GUJ93_ZPchr0012g21400 [Zizania palustris]